MAIASIFAVIDSTKFGSRYQGTSPLISFAILAVFIFLFYLSRVGLFIKASYVLIGIYFILSTYLVYSYGVDVLSGLLFFILIIIISGILINTKFALGITFAASFVLMATAYLQANDIVRPNIYWKENLAGMDDTIIIIIIFGIIATVSWLSNREIEKSLKRARRSETKLKEERDLLEVKVEDRTKELKKLQVERVSQLYRFAEFGRLSSGLFHDLINPLTAVSLNLGQMKDTEETKVTDVKSHLGRAMDATKRMENFIMAVRRQIAKQEDKTLFSLAQEIDQAVQVLSYKAREANVTIKFFPPIETIQLHGDAIKFSQVVTNLITNAIDAYTNIDGGMDTDAKKREVEICLQAKNGIIYITVEDWGYGIPEESVNKIFQPFFTTKGSKGGVGIGLSLIKEIIEKDFLGSIKVESEKNKGTKFIVTFPHHMKIKENKTVNDPLYHIINEQQEDGSFLDSIGSQSIVFTALILSCLHSLKETDEVKSVKQKAAHFLLSQKDTHWLFSENIGINFCVLSALMKYNSQIIDGAVIAKVLMSLTSVEIKEGGPYCSWISKQDKNIDRGINTTVAYFLSLQNVNLPELDNLIESAIAAGDFKSEFFASDYPLLYVISKFYKGDKKQKLIDCILQKKEAGKWDNPLHSALAVSSLINLNYPPKKLHDTIQYFKNCHEETLYKSYPFYSASDSSFALNVAFYLEALTLIAAIPEEKTGTSRDLPHEEKQIYDRIIKIAEERFSQLDEDIKDHAMQQIQRTIKGNPDKQMAFMSYYFKKALGKRGERISDQMIARLGLANIFFWTAFIIYDDFMDEEGNPKVISTANLFARDFTSFFSTILPSNPEFNRFFRKVMDKLDAANTWEAVHCRARVNGSKIEIPHNIPDYGDYEKAYEPASAHILGPVEMLFYLGYQKNSPEVQNLVSYFKNYLIAMQINDDIHDWKEDLERGHISTVVAMLLKDIDPQKTEIDMKKDLPELQKVFWFKTIVAAGKTAILHTEKSRQALQALTIVEDSLPLERLITITENAAKQVLKEQKATTDFLKTYKD